MADYSVNATNLQGSDGSGSKPVQPVQEQVVGFGIPKIVGDAVDIFAKGLELNKKEEAEKAKQGIVGAFVREQTVINDAVSTGQMKPSEAAARQRAIGNQYLASYPQYSQDFMQANNTLKGITEKGEIENQMQTEQKRKEQLVSSAQNAGYIIPSGADESTVNQILNAHQTSVRIKQEWEDQLKMNAEKRAQGTYDAAQAERENKERSLNSLTTLSSSNITAFAALGGNLADSARSGKISWEAAQANLAAQYATISQVIQTAAGTNPELAAPIRSIFSSLNDVNQKLLDPKADVEKLQNEKQRLITQAQVMALQRDPKTLSLVATSQLMPNSIPLQASSQATTAYTYLSQALPNSGLMIPQVVGDPNTESDVYKMAGRGIDSLNNGKVPDKVKGLEEASTLVNNIMRQTNFLAQTGQANPQSLKEVAKFFASPQMASMVNKGSLDPQLQQAAKRAFQMEYEPTVINAIGGRLDQVMPGADATKLSEAVNITFNGTGVVFSAKGPQTGRLGIPTVDMRNNAIVAQSLKSSQDALNQLIHIGAHMEGTTDYQKYWDENKHFFLPKIYPDPKQLKPGQVVNGYKWDGVGPWTSKSSYEKVN